MSIRFSSFKRICLAVGFLLLQVAVGHPEEVLETLAVGTNTFKNVHVIQSSPVDVLIGHDNGYERIRLQDLPPVLKAMYPYDAQKAADYQKQQVQEARVRHAQSAAVIRASLLSKEEQIRSQLTVLEKELKRINADIGVQDRRAKGKKVKSADRQYADELRRRKMEVRDQIWGLRDEFESTQRQRHKYESP